MFALLNLAHTLSLTLKILTDDIYRTLEKVMMNLNVQPPQPRYKPLRCVLTQWHHLKMLKQGGRAHDPSGIEGTPNGALAIVCPSCPNPSVNLPNGWSGVPVEKRYAVAPLCMLVILQVLT